MEISRSTIANILREHGIDPAPERGARTKWSTFLKSHWKTLVASDFLTVEVWRLPGWANLAIGDCLSQVHRLDERIGQYDRHLAQIARQDSRAARLKRLNGIGDTTATAILAIVGNGAEFNNARQFVAWLSLVPAQYSSGGKARLGHITKAGDP